MGGSHGDMLLALNNSFVYLGQTLAAILGGLLANIGQLRSLPLVGAAIQILAAGVLIASVIMLRPRPKCNAT